MPHILAGAETFSGRTIGGAENDCLAWSERKHRASLSAAERELERVQTDIGSVIEAIKNGFAGPDKKAEWDALQKCKTTLQAKLDSADEPSLLHPGMAEFYRQKAH